MKFSTSIILAVLPLLSQVAASTSGEDRVLVARQRNRGGTGRGRGAAAAAAAAARNRNRQNQGQNGNGRGGAAAGGAAAGGAAAGGAAAGAGNNNNNAGNGAATGGAGAGNNNNAGNGAATGGAGAGNNNAGNGAAAGNNNNNNNNAGDGAAAGGDPQTSLTLDPAVIAKGFANNGQQVPVDGQVASLTSTNNFINFCLTVPGTPITDGKQVQGGSCNPAPIGVIPSIDRMPSSKFVSPANGDTIQADTQFTIQMAIKNLQAGNFVNAQENYFAAPQTLQNGVIVGHTHVVIEKLTSLDQKEPTDPRTFQFFKGVNGAAVNGVVTADVTVGVPAGAYRLCSINSSSNHQPVIVPVAQHGSLDDCVYFTANADGQAAGGAAAGGAAAGDDDDDNNNNAGAGGAAGNNNNNNAGNGAAGGAAGGNNNNNAGNGAAGGAAGGAAAGNNNNAGNGAAGGAAGGAAAGNNNNNAGNGAAGGAAGGNNNNNAGNGAAGGAAGGAAAGGNNNAGNGTAGGRGRGQGRQQRNRN